MVPPAQSCLQSDALQLRPEQEACARFLLLNRGLLAIHSTGTGKTLTSAAAATCLITNSSTTQVHHIVVLTKKSAVSQFHLELMRYADGRIPNAALTCTTHQQFFNKLANHITPSHTFLILDEAHEFTNPKAASTKQLLKFSQACHRVLLLTATPIVNTPYDLAPLIAMVRGEPVLPSRAAFDDMLAKPSAFRAYFSNAIHVNLINKNADPNYPRVTRHNISIPMTPSTEAEYLHQSKNQIPFDMNLRQLSLGHGACEKCDWLLKHIKSWIARGEGKILVYTAFLGKGTVLLTQLLKENGINTLIIDSAAKGERRHQAALMFNKKSFHLEERDLRAIVDDKTKVGERCGDNNVMLVRHITKPNNTLQAKRTYTWQTATGKPKHLSSPETDYIDTLVIPPAWSPVEVCTKGEKLLWVAQDKKGNWQYRYTRDWQVQQEYKKVMRLKELDASFWKKLQHTTEKHMKHDTWTPNKLLATATRLMQTCHFRVGTTNKLAHSHYGLMTLESRHIKATRTAINIEFIGKSGKTNVGKLDNASHPALFQALRELVKTLKTPDAKLFHGATAEHLRAYLDAIKPGIRPKHFRTYYANSTLIELLCLDTRPSAYEQTPQQRASRLREATRIISTALNNSPEVSKSSYIFTGFWVLYLCDPMQFQRISSDSGSKSGSKSGSNKSKSLLAAFVKHFDDNAVDWQAMLAQFKDSGGVADFMGVANVLLITDAGAESIDLTGTRHIVFMTPTWTPALEAQIIGRGQRYNSHAALPSTERTVHVWKLFLDFPPTSQNKTAIERHMEELVRSKEAEQNRIYAALKKVSVV